MLFVKFIILLLALTLIECAPPSLRDDKVDNQIDVSNVLIANRPDHLKGVPLERDGELNKEFRKELLAGDSHGDNKALDDESAKTIITDMFKRADKNQDGQLSVEELTNQIKKNTKEHLEEARLSSDQLFQRVDENGDNLVSWDEYKKHFLIKNNLVDKEHAAEHAKEHSNNVDANSRLKLADEHEAFKRADADNDGLDETEWLGFQHPEHSRTMLNEMTNEILKSFDKDQDGQLTVEEFAHLPEGIVENAEMDREYVEARRHEFNNVIDLNKDGKATVDELRTYVDPLNDYHTIEEVREIFEFADENKDSNLSLKELLNRAEILISSGFIHPKSRLHDDL